MMNHKQPVQPIKNDQTVDNDLQKAIDDITNTTNTDPVFSDPVAAPSSVPEGDAGQLGEPVGPFPEPKLEVVPPTSEPIAPLESMNNIPDLEAFSGANAPVPPVPATPAMPEMPATTPDPADPAAPEAPTEPIAPAEPAAPAANEAPVDIAPQDSNTSDIKKAALRDLVPLLGKVNMDAQEKFRICQDIFNDLKDPSVLEPAYQAAREITDESERANALLFLIRSIDSM